MSPELEIILHPSRRRLQWLGVFTIVGHLLFWYIWTHLIPQNFEDWRVRFLLSLSGLGLIFLPEGNAIQSRWLKVYFSVICWLQLPLFFTWMYWMSGTSAMWMASTAAMIIIYYHLTDWRMATLGMMAGVAAATLLAMQMSASLPPIPDMHWVVFAFAWVSAHLLAMSSANLRRERLRHSLYVIGIMAHELRTPLATLALIAQALRNAAPSREDPGAQRQHDLATRIETLTRAINHHIDLQMSNARYAKLQSSAEQLSAAQLVRQAIEDYPFGSRKEKLCVELILHNDFWFRGSKTQFLQVLNNLIKNALHSLKVAQSRYAKGDLRIELGMRDGIGRIQLTDQGMGIDRGNLHQIFEPFFSTSNETGHGLGLAYCKQVVESAQGSIRVASEPAMGATFTVQLPCCLPPENHYVRSDVSPLPST